MWERGKFLQGLAGKPEGPLGKHRHRWKGNMNMDDKNRMGGQGCGSK
jgi:hypothetical protein